MTSSYLGPMGGLLAFKCPSSLAPPMSRPSVERVSTSGVVRTQVGPRPTRQWRMDWSAATPSELSSFAALVAGEFGYGPFWFVNPWAQVTNVIPPDGSVTGWPPMGGQSAGGPVNLAGSARAGRSMVIENPALYALVPGLSATQWLRVPVVPGLPVTGSVWATGPGVVQVRLQWYSVDNTHISSTPLASFTPGAAMRRIHQSSPAAPEGAASVLVAVLGASRLARPAVTWTSKLMDWYVGQGAASVEVPTDFNPDILLALDDEADEYGRLMSAAATIREIG